METIPGTIKNILVTGGGGFLGTAICKKLLEKKYNVINFSRNEYIHLTEAGITTRKGNLTDCGSIKAALEGIDAIFHVAAIAGVWGKESDYYNTNFLGTQNLVNEAKAAGIKYFIYTSTPSVVFGKDDIENGDESTPFPDNYLTHYARTKSMAEKLVLSSIDESFYSMALRPHLIWGPNDPHIIPRLVKKAKAGKLKRVGAGNNLVDVIYVDNAAEAHIQALEALAIKPSLAGNAYFIGQERPVNLWEFINSILSHSNVDLVDTSISFSAAYKIGAIFEGLFKLAGIHKPEPPMTRFVATQLAKSHFFSHAKANKDFGYVPSISIEEGLKRTFSQEKI